MTSSYFRRSIARAASLGVLGATLLGGCKSDDEPEGCSATYFGDTIVFELGPRELVLGAACAEGPLLVRMCLATSCNEVDLLPSGTCEPRGRPDQPVFACEGEPGGPPAAGSPATFDLRLFLTWPSFGAQVVSLTIQSQAGEVLHQEKRDLAFEGRGPYGFDCGARSTELPPERFDLSAELASFGGACDAAR
ncbi:MAG TPA: hypothetical protein VFS00_01535 [Polyangiaceae bacterium]|nr:hypothetical protein [Polyangiaceae bacterium]